MEEFTEKEIVKALNQDIKDIQGLINYKDYGLNKKLTILQSRGIIINLKEHLR